MGAWNATIFGNDTSLDVKEEFFRRFNLGEEVENIKNYIIEMRRYFHQNPELSLEEFETTKKIIEEMFNFSKDKLNDLQILSENNKFQDIIQNIPFLKNNKEKSKIDLKFGDLEIKVTMNSDNK